MPDSCIDVDHDGGPKVWTEKIRRARKPHKCCECGEEIKPGRLYEYFAGLWEGRWDAYKTCARCVNIRADYFRSWIFGTMVDDFMEVHGFDYRDGLPPDFAPCHGGAPKVKVPIDG